MGGFHVSKTTQHIRAYSLGGIIIGLLLLAPTTLRAEQTTLNFILDASGSMWGQTNGQAKIEIAKNVMEELINGLPDDMQVGLVAYGHRRKGDCRDVEELVPVSRLDKNALVKKIKSIQPKGKTPMALSVQQTIARLKERREKGVVILVSDGKETCAQDPCGEVAALKKEYKDFTLYVIGFDVTDDERQQLTCMAEAGGGRYYAAKNADEFKLAARQAVLESQNFGELAISPIKNGRLFEALVTVSTAADGRGISAGYSTPETPFTGKVAPGKYDITVRDLTVPEKPTMEIKGVNVQKGETASRSIEFAQEGELHMQALKNGQPFRALYKIYKSGDNGSLYSHYTEGKGVTKQKILSGTYDVYFQDRSVLNKPERWARGVKVISGQPAEATVEFPREGELAVRAMQNGTPARVLYVLYPAGSQNRLTQGYTDTDKADICKVLPGKYLVRFIVKKPEKARKDVTIEVQAGKTATAVGSF